MQWVKRVNAMTTFQELFVPIVLSLEKMHFNVGKVVNAATSTKATPFFTSFDFIVTLVIVRNVLERTLPVARLLQSKNNDVMDSVHFINSVVTEITGMRREISFLLLKGLLKLCSYQYKLMYHLRCQVPTVTHQFCRETHLLILCLITLKELFLLHF